MHTQYNSSCRPFLDYSSPELSEVQNKETNLSWYKGESRRAGAPPMHNHSGNNSNGSSSSSGGGGSSSNGGDIEGQHYDPPQSSRNTNSLLVSSNPQGNPVIIDINKQAPYIGEQRWCPIVD